MIKNAITYNVEMPTSADMLEFTTDYLAKKPGNYTVSTLGFAPHPITGDIVSDFNGGYCLTIKRWVKRIDRTAVNEALSERVANFGRALKKKEKEEIKDNIILEMLPYILPSPKYIFAYYHEASSTLIIDSASSKDADQATSLMRKAIGSLKATTLYIDTRIDLTASLKSHLERDAEFINENIALGKSLELASVDGKIKFTDLDLTDESTSDEIVTQITSGCMFIKSVQLSAFGATFDLTNEFKIKKLKLDFEIDKDEDKYSIWLSESFAATEVIVNATSELVGRFQVVE